MSHPNKKSSEKKRHYCCICSNYCGKTQDGRKITLHRIPAKERIRKLWIKQLKSLNPKGALNLKNDRLCSAHFLNVTYSKENPIPCVFKISGRPKKKFITSKIVDDTPVPNCIDLNTPSQNSTASNVDEENEYWNPSLHFENAPSKEEISLIFHNYCGPSSPQKCKLVNKEAQTNLCASEFNTVATQTEISSKENGTQTSPVEALSQLEYKFKSLR